LPVVFPPFAFKRLLNKSDFASIEQHQYGTIILLEKVKIYIPAGVGFCGMAGCTPSIASQ
jgi:hypothetical protein